MKISYQNPTARRMNATVWVNDTAHTLTPDTTIEVVVKRQDSVRFKVGKFSKTHPITFQSPSANFVIQPAKKLQVYYLFLLMALVLLVYLTKQAENVWLSALLVLAVFGYVAMTYLWGYVATPEH